MRIDWAQTMIGTAVSPAPAHAHLAEPGETPRGAAGRATRLAGFLAASLFIGLAIATLPARGTAITLRDVLALSGFLLAHAVGLFLLAGGTRRKVEGAAVTPFLALPFATLAGLEAPAIIALGCLMALDCGAVLAANASRRLAFGMIALGGGIAVAGLQWSTPGYGNLAMLAVALTPVLTSAILRLQTRQAATADQEANRILKALLAIALRQGDARAGRHVLLVDGIGAIDPAGTATFAGALSASAFPENSLTTATLIADRVALLNALSRAIHHSEAVEGLTIRLRHDPAGAGYPMPPRFEASAVSVYPMPGRSDRAIVALASLAQETPGQEIPRQEIPGEGAASGKGLASSAASPALARALHDCTAPFNAGLGFLEMIADPRLAPRDIATYREFAAEAHKAVSDAHRNSVLLGRWVRVLDSAETCRAERAEILPRRLVNDAIRAMNLREAEDRGEIRIDEPEALPVASLPLTVARFAVETLLREAQHGGASRLTLTREGDDLVIACAVADSAADPAESDAFQHAIEAAVMRAGDAIRFEPGDDAGRCLRLAGAFSAHGVLPKALAPAAVASARALRAS